MSTQTCHCAEHIAAAYVEHHQHTGEGEIYQTSLMSALIDGVYEGDTTMADLLKHGDFGLGTFNQLDGELIAFDKTIFQLRGDGSARHADPDQKTPFAVMTFFKPEINQSFDHPMSRQELHDVIDSLVPSDNIFCAVRIDGAFEHVRTRTVPKQTPPYKPMLEAIAAQPEFRFDHVNGVIAGFRSPQYTQGINVAGYHEHFITDTRQGGGHVQDYELACGTLQIGRVSKLVIDLPTNASFLGANLTPDNIHAAIEQAEK
ncbi:acetolactate decarboxylase [Salinivibrio sp. IB574]|uniref:acetolactate decarboxylase n=1 Tax=Salinivibrio sp. IB574 TaxID=1909444 RepID=UPI000988BA26|nr:acetolactate decarboxylase [Salinivibrio sp. IB574]OOF21856.1 acetolactate decarboxylase [Salinivibrio sp. IB574]